VQTSAESDQVIYTYPDESSQVVVYCLEGRNMLVCRTYAGL